MSNTAWTYTKKEMTMEGILILLGKLNEKYFDKKLTWEVEGRYIEMCYGGKYIRSFYLKTKKRFEVSHYIGGGDVGWWVETLIMHSVAKEYEGILRNDSHDKKEEVNVEKWDTFDKYLKIIWPKVWPLMWAAHKLRS